MVRVDIRQPAMNVAPARGAKDHQYIPQFTPPKNGSRDTDGPPAPLP